LDTVSETHPCNAGAAAAAYVEILKKPCYGMLSAAVTGNNRRLRPGSFDSIR
jgi:hypothetical protein